MSIIPHLDDYPTIFYMNVKIIYSAQYNSLKTLFSKLLKVSLICAIFLILVIRTKGL